LLFGGRWGEWWGGVVSTQRYLAHLEGHLIFLNVKRWGLKLLLKSGRDLTPIRALPLLHPVIYICLGS